MNSDQQTLTKRLRSARTWERADWWNQYKSGVEAKEARGVIKREDYLPLFLATIKPLVLLIPLCILLWLSWKTSIVIFYIVLGISAPLYMGVNYLFNYFIRKYIVLEE